MGWEEGAVTVDLTGTKELDSRMLALTVDRGSLTVIIPNDQWTETHSEVSSGRNNLTTGGPAVLRLRQHQLNSPADMADPRRAAAVPGPARRRRRAHRHRTGVLMRTHPVDLTSLVWGIILATITGLLAVLVFTDTTPDIGILVPAALICAGLLVLITALLRRGPHPGTLELDR